MILAISFYKHVPWKSMTILIKYTVSKLISTKFLWIVNFLPWKYSRQLNIHLVSHLFPWRRFWVAITNWLEDFGQVGALISASIYRLLNGNHYRAPLLQGKCIQKNAMTYFNYFIYPQKKGTENIIVWPSQTFWPALCYWWICGAVGVFPSIWFHGLPSM